MTKKRDDAIMVSQIVKRLDPLGSVPATDSTVLTAMAARLMSTDGRAASAASIEVAHAIRPNRTAKIRIVLATAAVLALSGSLLSVVLSEDRSRKNPTAADPASASLVVNPGDAVIASGILLTAPDGRAQICNITFRGGLGEASRLEDPDYVVNCQTHRVAVLINVMTDDTNTVRLNGAVVSLSRNDVKVGGVLTDDGIKATSITSAETTRVPASPGPSPCGSNLTSLGTSHDAPGQSLQHEIDSHPGLYGTQWTSSDGVLNVGTTNSPTTQTAAIEAVYAGPLCVYPVSLSYERQAQIVQQINAAEGTNVLEITESGGTGADVVTVVLRLVSAHDAADLAKFGADISISAAIQPASGH